ncbi:phage head closure protein, partial [Clostridium botulinum]|uniref:phage head closure protein n=1 Tax=Clostridium botulinum TaxID=1491 RepID=UPI001E4CE445
RYRDVENEVNDIEHKLQDIKTVWASVNPIRGREYLENKKVQAELTYKVTIRYTKGIAPDMLIKFKDKILNIQDIINPYESNKFLELMCTEKVENE